MSDDVVLAELLCTRLCHDLTGPIGAVNNGVEFLSEENDGQKNPAIDLIESSAQEAVSRLQFYRYAYGKSSETGDVSLMDKRKLVNDFFAGTKITIEWPDNQTDMMNGLVVRLLVNLMIIASSTLMKGGSLKISVHPNPHGARTVQVVATGPTIKWDAEQNAILEGKAPVHTIAPKTVQLYLTHVLATSLNYTLSMVKTDTSFGLSAVETALERATA